MKDIILLIIFQTFWASSYVAMKVAMTEMPLGMIMILRYGIAALVFVSVAGFKGWSMRKRDLLLIIGVGVLDFTLSPYLQLQSLKLTYATDTAVLVSFEPIVTAILAVFFLREHMSKRTIGVFMLATIGVLIMSDVHMTGGDIDVTNRLLGNGLFFISVACEALYSIISRYTTRRVEPLKVITLMTLSGAITNSIIYIPTITWDQVTHIGIAGWGSILFLALACSVVAYGGWTYLTKRIPVNRLTLSLYLQPLIGGIMAKIVLGEQASTRTLIGAGIVMSSLLFWLVGFLKRRDGAPLH